jgi:hypothetical protein
MQPAREVLKEPRPRLNIDHKNPRSSAVHRLIYCGQLRPWANFETSIEAACTSVNWRLFGSVLAHRPINAGTAHLSHEHIVCGDDTRPIPSQYW